MKNLIKIKPVRKNYIPSVIRTLVKKGRYKEAERLSTYCNREASSKGGI